MKHRFLACPLVALLMLPGAARPGLGQVVGNPGDPTIVVYPTGVYPADLANVQYAVDNVASPGTVVMKSTDMSLAPLAFNFGGTAPGNGGVVKLLRPDITLTGDGLDNGEPKTKIVGGGGAFRFSSSVSGSAMVFAVRAPGVVIRQLALSTAFAYTGVFIASTTAFPASDHPVVVEWNHVNVLNFGVLTSYTAAFPVKIDRNVLEADALVVGRWVGFTLRPITTPVVYDEPAVPVDSLGNPVRHPFQVTNNTMFKTPGGTATGQTLAVYGWANYYNVPAGADPDNPDLGCRAYTVGGVTRYQCVEGDNGPVLIRGNTIHVATSPDAVVTAIDVGTTDGGLNGAIVAGNTVSGTTYAGLRRYGYGRGVTILDNDFSGLEAVHQMSIQAPDALVAGNTLGAIVPYSGWVWGVPQPAVLVFSGNFYPDWTPMPRPTENCILLKNDYRLTKVVSGAILLASRAELRYPNGVGNEVKNNLIFESGGFPRGTGGALRQVFELNVLTNPDTGLPYVHDNRIVGQSANGLEDPGVSEAIDEDRRDQEDVEGPVARLPCASPRRTSISAVASPTGLGSITVAPSDAPTSRACPARPAHPSTITSAPSSRTAAPATSRMRTLARSGSASISSTPIPRGRTEASRLDRPSRATCATFAATRPSRDVRIVKRRPTWQARCSDDSSMPTTGIETSARARSRPGSEKHAITTASWRGASSRISASIGGIACASSSSDSMAAGPSAGLVTVSSVSRPFTASSSRRSRSVMLAEVFGLTTRIFITCAWPARRTVRVPAGR